MRAFFARGADRLVKDDWHMTQLLLTTGILVSLAYYLAGYFGARGFFRQARRNDPRKSDDGVLPGVTILKPLKGLDVDLFDNLSTFCRQNHPLFQIVFGVADADDPAVKVVRRLRKHYPTVAIDLVIDGRVYGTNYKISNLHNMYRAAKHDVVIIADSDIRVPPDYLRRIVTQLGEPGVGIVTCLYRAVSTSGLPTLVESLFINTDFSPSVLVARLVEERRYAFGATIALRRSVLDEIGGFLPLANLLADDYYLGNRVAERGYTVALSDMVVETVLAVGSWRRLLDHQLRWARTYRCTRPASYFALVITHGPLWATLNLLYHHFSPLACATAIVMYGTRIILSRAVANEFLHAPLRWREALLVPLKDLFVSAVWALCFLGNTVKWSGHEFRVLRGGEMIRLAPAHPRIAAYPPLVAEESERRAASL
jgi:ceramide glucosyltransferase